MLDFASKIWDKTFSSVSDEKYRNDVKLIAELLISLSKHFKFNENSEGKLFIHVKRDNEEAKRMINLLINEEYGKNAFFKIKEFESEAKKSLKFSSQKLVDASHALEVCRYFRRKYGVLYSGNDKFAREEIDDYQNE